MSPRRRRRLPYQRRIPLLAALAALPAVVVALALLWTGSYSSELRWTLTALVAGGWLVFLTVLRERLIRPLQTLSNLIAALREEDYSMRVRFGDPEDPLGLLSTEVNVLGETLRGQRLEVLEATALLRRVMEEIDVAVLAFDDEGKLRLANRAAEALLDRSEASLRGRSAASLGLEALLEGEAPRVADLAFPGGASRWEVRRSVFRQEGRPHTLLVLSDLSRALREEERKAWQRLVRVLSHEINNSLAPIRSIADSLQAMLARDGGSDGPDPSGSGNGTREDLAQGLGIIAGRAEALSRFMSSYARLARLPPPELAPLPVGAWVRRVAELETRLTVQVQPGPDAEVLADGDQLDQLLINLIDNAVDAARETGGGVRIGWSAGRRQVEVWVEDDGPGLPETANLFVPFFTTKPEGSGIGLALGRQIAEAHGGSLTLADRPNGAGCVARVRLPRA